MKETKVAIGQAPQAVRDTIQRELVGAELEDIAREDGGWPDGLRD